MTRPVHILYMHDSPVMGGAENSLLQLAKHLDRERFRPFFLCHAEGPFAEALRALDVEVAICPYPSIRRPQLLKIATTVQTMTHIARERQADIVHGNTPRSNLYAAAVGKRCRRSIVWHARNLLTPGMIDIDARLAFLPDKIICNSDAIRARFGNNPKAITIINGVDFATFDRSIDGAAARAELGIPRDAFVVGMTSRLEEEKGHDCFLRAAKRIGSEIPNAWFLVVGKAFVDAEAREAHLRRLASEMGVADRTIFTGFRTDIPRMLAAMDVFVLAARAEPCGRVLFEAMAMAKPIVATNTGGTPEIVVDGQTGWLFDPDDADALAAHVVALARNPTLRRQMGEAGYERARRHFSIEAHVRKTEAVYEELLEQRDRNRR